jgi:hypothetical protein
VLDFASCIQKVGKGPVPAGIYKAGWLSSLTPEELFSLEQHTRNIVEFNRSISITCRFVTLIYTSCTSL